MKGGSRFNSWWTLPFCPHIFNCTSWNFNGIGLQDIYFLCSWAGTIKQLCHPEFLFCVNQVNFAQATEEGWCIPSQQHPRQKLGKIQFLFLSVVYIILKTNSPFSVSQALSVSHIHPTAQSLRVETLVGCCAQLCKCWVTMLSPSCSLWTSLLRFPFSAQNSFYTEQSLLLLLLILQQVNLRGSRFIMKK